MDEINLFISTGDISGDNATARLLESLRKKTDCEIAHFGLGGEKLKALGQDQLASMDQIAVIGFWEVAKNYFFFRSLFYKTLEEIKKRKPDICLLVDYPGFNLRLAKEIKKLNIPIVYYISPQVWAWGKKRIPAMRENIDLMLSILPFEKDFFDKNDINTEFVGHYLTEDIPDNYLASEIKENGHLALLPGSRKQEIEKMLTPMLDAARLIHKRHRIKIVLAAIKGLYDYESVVQKYSDIDIEIVYNNSRKVLFDSKVVITASGTATLETGLIGRPMVIIYKTGFLTYQIAKRVVELDKIGLINLVHNQKVVPELIQNEASPKQIAFEIDKYLSDKNYFEKTKTELDKTVTLLGEGSASDNAADQILNFLKIYA